MRYAADDDGWQQGDYAVDHGHVDDFYAPSAAQREGDEIRLECLAAERAPRRDNVLVTRPAYGQAGRSRLASHSPGDDRGTFGFTPRADARYAEKPARVWCPVHEENVNRYNHDWSGH